MRLAQIVRHTAGAGAAGLALGGALGLTEIASEAGQARSGGLTPEEALIGALVYAALFALVAAPVGALLGLAFELFHLQPRSSHLARGYAAAGAFLFPLAVAGLGLARYAPGPALGALTLGAAALTGVGLVWLALRVPAPRLLW